MDINGFAQAVGSFDKQRTDKVIDNEKSTAKIDEKYSEKINTEDNAVVYTHKNVIEISSKNQETIEKMQRIAEEKTAQLQSLVEKMFLKQGEKFTTLSEALEDIRDGIIDISPEDAVAAAQDIDEDGYWGVKQTSDRLFSFAKALANDDPKMADILIDVLVAGYDEATKQWGDELPDICKQTLEATKTKLRNWRDGVKDDEDKNEADKKGIDSGKDSTNNKKVNRI